jgi:hypothetical protein
VVAVELDFKDLQVLFRQTILQQDLVRQIQVAVVAVVHTQVI